MVPGGLVDQIEQSGDLDCVADYIVRALAQDPDLGITWEVFDQDGQAMVLTPANSFPTEKGAYLNSQNSSLVITVSYHAFTDPTRMILSTGCPNQVTSHASDSLPVRDTSLRGSRLCAQVL